MTSHCSDNTKFLVKFLFHILKLNNFLWYVILKNCNHFFCNENPCYPFSEMAQKILCDAFAAAQDLLL